MVKTILKSVPAEPIASPFQTEADLNCTLSSHESAPAALLINPDASAVMLLGAVRSRMERLSKNLEAWSYISNHEASEVPLRLVVDQLRPLAEEICLFLDALEIMASNR